MNPPQGTGFAPHGPPGQGHQPPGGQNPPAGTYQMMYVPVMQQYPGQAQQTWAQQPGSHGSVPMMMPQGQMMMAVPQGSWGAPAAAGWGA